MSKGFTLIETLVAIALLSISFLGINYAFTMHSSISKKRYQKLKAVEILQTTSEEILNSSRSYTDSTWEYELNELEVWTIELDVLDTQDLEELRAEKEWDEETFSTILSRPKELTIKVLTTDPETEEEKVLLSIDMVEGYE